MAIQPEIVVDGDTAQGTWLIYMLFSKPDIAWVQGKMSAGTARSMAGGKSAS
jgi:hypothetical protein